VRLKHFVEIRPADALPASVMAGYAALIKGIFYSEQSLACVEDAFGVVNGRWPLSDTYTDESACAMRERGLQASIAGLSLPEWKVLLFSQAKKALGEEERKALEAIEQWSAQKRFAF